MAQYGREYGPKSTIFLDDVIDYPGSFTFSNQARKKGLEKCDWKLYGREIFELEA